MQPLPSVLGGPVSGVLGAGPRQVRSISSSSRNLPHPLPLLPCSSASIVLKVEQDLAVSSVPHQPMTATHMSEDLPAGLWPLRLVQAFLRAFLTLTSGASGVVRLGCLQ
ncbi:hypothetical protein GWK47_024142 [Chionoecetes opilio]|uniref:Uncharacterized protein n=1 Tax=Chionoecetes opilio TaxID=41210 RepID=A0A8J5CDY1_CHIOP|nr:hypothetical protein GWK47_024142 [Chionoecetes opilio]